MSPPGLAVRVLSVLWPAFVGAALIEGLVFSLVDPLDLRWAGDVVDVARPAVYTLAFLLFWALTSACATVTLLLLTAPRGPRETGP